MIKIKTLLFAFRIIAIANSLHIPLNTLTPKNKSNIAKQVSNDTTMEDTTEHDLSIVISKSSSLFVLLHSLTTASAIEKLEALYHFFVESKQPATTKTIIATLQSIRIAYNTLADTDTHYKLIQLPYQEFHDLGIKLQDETLDHLTAIT